MSSEVDLPAGFTLQRLERVHSRRTFRSGEAAVDAWLATRSWQHQQKRLSVTHVLVDPGGRIAGYYTLATGQVDFGDLPGEHARRLPRRHLPVAVLAWLGVDSGYQGRGFGRLLLAQALRDCHAAGQTYPFVAVILDCLSDKAKTFYRQWDFAELPGHPYRLFLSAQVLEAMMDRKP